MILALHRAVDFGGRLVEQEQPARDQDQVADRKRGLERGFAVAARRARDAEIEYRRGHADDPRDHRKQRHPHDQREADADAAPLAALTFGKLVRKELGRAWWWGRGG